jgi:putative transposase
MGPLARTPAGFFVKALVEICRAQRYEHSPERVGRRAGFYERKLETKSRREVRLKLPKLRSLPFETAIIERYRRR